MKKYFFIAALLGLLGTAGWYTYQNQQKVAEYIPGLEKETTIHTFEVPITISQLMQKQEKALLPDLQHTFGQAATRFSPCVLFSVKYAKEDKRTQEAKLLFSLEDGEMILDTGSCTSTNGFEDCLLNHADAEDFRLLQVIQKKGGTISKEALAHDLGLQSEQVFQRLDSLRRKHLVAIRGDTVRIHLPSPLLKVIPDTRMDHLLVTKTVMKDNLLPERYSKSDVRRLMKAAFGADFAIRSEELVYIPIFQVDVKNPDGSTLKTFWNGLTMKRLAK